MNARQKIQKALELFMEPADARACNVYKGVDYGGGLQDYGWWYRPFGQNAVWLGRSVKAALATIEDIAESRHE